MLTDLSIFNDYLKEGFKPILCKGYHPKFNQKKDYKTAKEPIIQGFTKTDYRAPSKSEIKKWMEKDGWIGWLIPKGYIALDVEDSGAIRYIENFCKQKGIQPLVHITNKGKHFFFKIEKDVSAASTVYAKSGIKVTYRVGGKNYLILAPINGRQWQV